VTLGPVTLGAVTLGPLTLGPWTLGTARRPGRAHGIGRRDRRTIDEVPAAPDRFPVPAPLARLTGQLGLGVFMAFLVLGVALDLGHPGLAAAGVLVGLLAGAPLFLARPRFPLGYAAVATAGVVVLGDGQSFDVVWFAVLVLSAWCVLFAGMRVALVYGAGAVLLFVGEWLLDVQHNVGWAPWTAAVIVIVLITALVRHEFVLVEQLRAAQAGLAERSRAEERHRIARELHDVIAHSLTVSLLHITSARLAVEHDPADASRALAEAERLGQQSLTEVRATMGLLRSGPVDGIAPPVPGTGQLADLVQHVRNAGADISLVIDGDIEAVPATTGSTVYRIVQEALTNATRHAPGCPVTVRVVAGGARAEVDVDSAGPPTGGSGLGVDNMRERAQAVGGICTAGPGGRGWVVHASLPFQRGIGTQ
jgi:signal transduction histidine kinase